MENSTNLKGYTLLINQDIDAYESTCDAVDIINYSPSNDLNEAIEKIERFTSDLSSWQELKNDEASLGRNK